MEVKINPLAYVKVYQHAKVFARDDRFIYGLLTGYVEDEKPYPQDYIPLSHSYGEPIDFELKHEIFAQIEAFNKEHYDPQYIYDQIVGWVRSCPLGAIEPSDIDKNNHMYIQTAYCEQAVAIFIPPTADQYEMSLKRLKGVLPEIDKNSIFEEVDWNFGEIEDLDNLFQTIITLQRKRKKKAPLMEEVFEEPVANAPEGAVEKVA